MFRLRGRLGFGRRLGRRFGLRLCRRGRCGGPGGFLALCGRVGQDGAAGFQVGQHRAVPAGRPGLSAGRDAALPRRAGGRRLCRDGGVLRGGQGGFQVLQESRNVLIPVRLAHGQPLHDDPADGRRAGGRRIGGGGQLVPVHPFHGVVGGFAHDAAVEGGGQGVHVGPGALAALAAVLFFRGVAGFQNHRKALDVGLGDLPCRAEVQQLGAPVPQHHDVVGADVPVDDAAGMDMLQRADDRQQQVDRLGGGQAAVFLQIVLEGHPVQEVHDDVGGAVFLAEIPHPHDAGLLIEAGQHPGLAQKLFLVFVEGVPMGAQGGEDIGGGFMVPVDIPGHVEFLDGDFQVQHGVAPGVGDAEAAFPQHPAHLVPLFDEGAGHQVVGQHHIAACIKAAVPAHRRPAEGFEAVGADSKRMFHRGFLLLSVCPGPRIPGPGWPPPHTPPPAGPERPSSPPGWRGYGHSLH